MSKNSITPSRAFLTIAVLVLTTGGSPLGPGRQSRTPQAQLATGFGEPTSSTRHMRQLPAIDSRSWKQNRGISAPAASHACSSVYSGGTSISLPSMFSLVMPSPGSSCDRSGAARRFPQLRAFNAFPAERMPARPVRAQMFEPGDRLLDGGPVRGRDPPHDEIGPGQVLETFGPPAVEAVVHGLSDMIFHISDASPAIHL